MSDYRHGAYADIESTRDYIAPPGVGTIPVYFGRAPIHQLSSYDGKTGTPILISSYNDAVVQIGYSDDWSKFELCEAVYAHFKNTAGSVGPIVVINTLDPESGKLTSQKITTLQFSRGKAILQSTTAILSTITIAEKTIGVDFSAEYARDGLSILLKDLKGGLSSVEISYYDVNASTVDENSIADAIQSVLPKVYYELQKVPTLLCAPGWSDKKIVYEALVAAAEKINGHWYAYVNADLDCATATTIEKAITAKEGYEIESGAASLLWPMAKKGDKMFHASTLNTVTMQRTDFKNGNLPYETPSNKEVDMASLCLADGTKIQYDQTQANRLNAKGINTMTYWEGSWRIWGAHTAVFQDGSSMDSRDIFDCNVRMVHYIANSFQRRYGDEVDKPMTRSRKDTILNDFQAELDRLIENGALMTGTIDFQETQNPVSDLVQGNFVFATVVMNPIPGKNLTARVRWTADGLTALYGGEDS